MKKNRAGVLSTSGESAGSDLRTLYREQPSREKHSCRESSERKEKELEEWLRDLEGMDRLVDDYVGDKIPLGEDHGPKGDGVLCMGEDCF